MQTFFSFLQLGTNAATLRTINIYYLHSVSSNGSQANIQPIAYEHILQP